MLEKMERAAAALGASIGAVALLLQLSLLLALFQGRGGTALAGAWRFLGFFTNVTNLLAVIVLAHAALRPRSRTGLGAPWIEAAATGATILAGVLNAALLSGRFHPQGMYKVAGLGLHAVLPTAVALFWLLRPHGSLRLEHAFYAMGWPLLYCVYALMRGAADGWYPYYFLDPTMLGIGGLVVNIIALGLAFLAGFLILLAIDRALGRARQARALPGSALSERRLAPP
jgi:hypothetical protein